MGDWVVESPSFIEQLMSNKIVMLNQNGVNEVVKIIGEKDKKIERLNGLINTMLEFNLFGEECPLNLGYTKRCNEEKAQDVFYEDDYCEKTCNDNYKKCWLKYFKRLQELKGVGKE